MDEWDKIILAKSDDSEEVIEPVSIAHKEAPVITEKKIEEKVVPLKKSDLGIVSEVKVEKSVPVFLKKEEAPAKALPPGNILSPYISKLPALWGLDMANKFATIALALAVSFGVYSFAVHVSELGFKRTVAGTVDSVLTRVGNTSIIVASLFDTKKSSTQSQLASPFAAVQVIDANKVTTSGQVYLKEPDTVFATGESFTPAVNMDSIATTTGPAILVKDRPKPAPAKPKPVDRVASVPKEVTPAPSKPVIPVVPQIVMKDGMYIVSYENSGFNPKTLDIGRGRTVQFVNNSGGPMRVSDTTGNPASRTFFQPRTVGNGGVFEYTFNDVGIYEYVNQNNASYSGAVVVK